MRKRGHGRLRRLGAILIILFVCLERNAIAANCYEPVACKGGALDTCFEACLSLSERLTTKNPAISIAHPECLVECDESCTKLCENPNAEDAPSPPPGPPPYEGNSQ